MKTESEQHEKPNSGRRSEVSCDLEEPVNYENLFDFCWEAFVVKKDKATGKLTGKPACCALTPV